MRESDSSLRRGMRRSARRVPDREDLYRIFAPHEQGYRSCQPPSEFLGPLVLPPPGRELGIPTPESDALSNALRRSVFLTS